MAECFSPQTENSGKRKGLDALLALWKHNIANIICKWGRRARIIIENVFRRYRSMMVQDTSLDHDPISVKKSVSRNVGYLHETHIALDTRARPQTHFMSLVEHSCQPTRAGLLYRAQSLFVCAYIWWTYTILCVLVETFLLSLLINSFFLWGSFSFIFLELHCLLLRLVWREGVLFCTKISSCLIPVEELHVI